MQLRTAADVDLRIDNHVVIVTGNFENLDLVVEADVHDRRVVEYRQVVPMIRRYVIAEYGCDFGTVAEVELHVYLLIHYRGRDVMRSSVDLAGSVE